MKLKINGKEYGLQWGMGAIEIYCDAMNCDIEGLDKAITSDSEIEKQKAIVHLVLAAIRNWCELTQFDFDVSYRQLQAWLDDAPQAQFDEILTDWKKSKYLGRTIGQLYFGELAEAEKTQKKSASRSTKS